VDRTRKVTIIVGNRWPVVAMMLPVGESSYENDATVLESIKQALMLLRLLHVDTVKRWTRAHGLKHMAGRMYTVASV
jgi:hypothetical protein